ncbi:hypothetical protein AL036_09675 [Salipiger aestuarii]|uniref:Uncharacterized protein n=1 Tax=Salipiger aestuarii TaxID=568098 RepID=A0A327Y3A6_9RHOB|nr:hypothetical protein [Salipiger aestuarii]EIE50948.1 hypothetical protein C357_11214 [Citreicella sp. 357]KAA8607738.1 hypothetical protein AL036_09675 [Salipiger aestuarii]KAA8609409.1 hypothetical protein AL037_15020 [Salipiger aestuarii]KAB2542004.1 hypothetical protein AL035_09410 [Salipiger aestuarii]RAK15600.1 hypothetical protein ATI53_102123 [Salipiger aestuarii]
MSLRIFVMDARDDGTARLSLASRGSGRGISRIACDLSQADVLQLVLFSEAAGLRDAVGDYARSTLDLDGLTLEDDPGADRLLLSRRTGYSEQTAELGRELFQAEIACVVDICLTRAEESRHGEILRDMIATVPIPLPLYPRLDPDTGDALKHRLREMSLMLLSDIAMTRGTALGRLLRGKKTHGQAQEEVTALVGALVRSLFPRTVSSG